MALTTTEQRGKVLFGLPHYHCFTLILKYMHLLSFMLWYKNVKRQVMINCLQRELKPSHFSLDSAPWTNIGQYTTGCKRRIRKTFEVKMWKESLLVE